MTFLRQKECNSCNNVYHSSQIPQQQFEKLIENDIGEYSRNGDDEIITTRGCCKECEEEYLSSIEE